MKKTSRDEWISAGITTLSESGEELIRIEYLCQLLQVSKGSFYHHFANMDQYIQALMERWKADNTTRIIAEADKASSVLQKEEVLNARVLEKDQQLEWRIRAWAVRDQRIKSIVDHVDQLRIDYLQKLYQERGFSEREALDIALIEYGALIGLQYLYYQRPAAEFLHLSHVFQQLVTHSKK